MSESIPAPSLPRVLIVDDERDNLDALKRLLRRDFAVTAALSGEEALALAAREPEWDVILSDQRMPGMNGSEFLEKVQAIDAVATRVLLTGFADLEAVIEAVNRGHIWRYLSKPWEPEELKSALHQATERTRMRRALDLSRRELERALNELRARDWSRERLLQILLHEFRTAPQILEGLRGLDPGGEDAAARLGFIERLTQRFATIESDITALLAEEKNIAQLPKEPLLLSELVRAATGLAVEAPPSEAPIAAHRATLTEAFKHLARLLAQNSAQAEVEVALDTLPGPRPDIYLTLSLSAARPVLPTALAALAPDPKLAWPLLLEPFVGAEDFRLHSTGLRVESARIVRLLAAFGGRAEFQILDSGKRIELIVAFKAG